VGRFPSPPGTRGSQKWIQEAINNHPHLLAEKIGHIVPGSIRWLSPLASDEYAEYRDEASLQLLGIDKPAQTLREFWPARGPQWDALGKTSEGEVVLVEAKAHVAELLPGPSQARSPTSTDMIERALLEASSWFGATPRIPWNVPFYQYANRLAHLYYFRELCRVPAYLAFVYFTGDHDMRGPATEAEWKGAIELTHRLLGLSRQPDSVVDVFIDVEDVRLS
jgi:hypothetical protein